MSAILPMPKVLRPAASARSRSVGSGGGTEKSRRLAVRVKLAESSPTKGRAITRPILRGSQWRRAASQSAIRRSRPTGWPATKKTAAATFCVGGDLKATTGELPPRTTAKVLSLGFKITFTIEELPLTLEPIQTLSRLFDLFAVFAMVLDELLELLLLFVDLTTELALIKGGRITDDSPTTVHPSPFTKLALQILKLPTETVDLFGRRRSPRFFLVHTRDLRLRVSAYRFGWIGVPLSQARGRH